MACVSIALPHDRRNALHAPRGLYILFLSPLCTRAVNHLLLAAVNRRSKPARVSRYTTYTGAAMPGLQVDTAGFVLVLKRVGGGGGE